MSAREKKYFKLFDVDIVFSPRRIMEVSYTCATNNRSACLLVLTVCPGVDHATHQIMLSSGFDNSGSDLRRIDTEGKTTLSTVAGLRPGRHFYNPIATDIFDGPSGTSGWVKKTYNLGGQLWDQKHIVEIGVLCTTPSTPITSGSQGYVAHLGEVCVIGTDDGTPRSTPRSWRDEPKQCANACVTSTVRHDEKDVSFGVEWDFLEDGEPVRFVLVYCLIGGGNSDAPRREYLGKSYSQFFWVAHCPWPQSNDDEPRLTIELQCVSWSGCSASSVCRLHLDK